MILGGFGEGLGMFWKDLGRVLGGLVLGGFLA